jgi:hypothetical protein
MYPFVSTGTKKGIIDNTNVQYNVAAENRISTVDSLFLNQNV